MAKTEQKIIYRKYVWQDSQYGVKLRSRSYEVHKHIAVNVDIIFTQILIQTQM